MSERETHSNTSTPPPVDEVPELEETVEDNIHSGSRSPKEVEAEPAVAVDERSSQEASINEEIERPGSSGSAPKSPIEEEEATSVDGVPTERPGDEASEPPRESHNSNVGDINTGIDSASQGEDTANEQEQDAVPRQESGSSIPKDDNEHHEEEEETARTRDDSPASSARLSRSTTNNNDDDNNKNSNESQPDENQRHAAEEEQPTEMPTQEENDGKDEVEEDVEPEPQHSDALVPPDDTGDAGQAADTEQPQAAESDTVSHHSAPTEEEAATEGCTETDPPTTEPLSVARWPFAQRPPPSKRQTQADGNRKRNPESGSKQLLDSSDDSDSDDDVALGFPDVDHKMDIGGAAAFFRSMVTRGTRQRPTAGPLASAGRKHRVDPCRYMSEAEAKRHRVTMEQTLAAEELASRKEDAARLNAAKALMGAVCSKAKGEQPQPFPR